MSADLEDFDDQMNELLKSIQTILEKDVPKLKGQERVEKCQYLRNRLVRAKQVHRSIMVEIRSLPPGPAAEWDIKAKQHEERIAKLSQDVEWAETTNQGKEEIKKKNVDEMTTVEITKHALMVQDKTQEATARAKKALDETIQIGISVNAEVKQQGEKLKEIEEGLDQVETNLKRADKQVRIFIRRLSSDKIFLMMIVLLVVGIIGAIVAALLKKNCPKAVQGSNQF
ncbi:hypothetical protein HDV06_007039 [Boothiomyces sp. JEL0866]|nr:hypothetical protein HDV06_007039 [Boothiomyces sp. JEL0866]